jgi:putative ABC transport system permease protein
LWEDGRHRVAEYRSPIKDDLLKSLRRVPVPLRMNWSETWNLAIESLRANRLRAALTMLGVMIGSACIVLVVTVALAGQHYISGEIEAVGSNIVFAGLESSTSAQNTALTDQISTDDMEAIRQDSSKVVQVAGTNDIPMILVAGGVEWPVSLVGVTRDFQKIRNLVISGGRYFDDGDFSAVSKVCLLTEHLAQTALPGESPIGRTIHVGELNFLVIGIFRERMGTFGQSEIRTDSVLVPFPIIKYYTGQEYIETLYAQADSPEDVPSVTQTVSRVLNARHRPDAEYTVENLASILETARRVSLAMTVVLLLIATLALVISGVGIMNIMLVSVTERPREIGVRKAVGARRDEILFQFLMEAILISGGGGLVGIGVAVLIPFLLRGLMRLLPIPSEIAIPISWLSVVVAFIVSCATGVFFGYLPASRAAQLEPAESLHYE